MIADIGVMVAAYIIARMCQMVGLPKEQANIGAKVLAVLAVAVALFCLFDLIIRGSSTQLPALR